MFKKFLTFGFMVSMMLGGSVFGLSTMKRLGFHVGAMMEHQRYMINSVKKMSPCQLSNMPRQRDFCIHSGLQLSSPQLQDSNLINAFTKVPYTSERQNKIDLFLYHKATQQSVIHKILLVYSRKIKAIRALYGKAYEEKLTSDLMSNARQTTRLALIAYLFLQANDIYKELFPFVRYVLIRGHFVHPVQYVEPIKVPWGTAYQTITKDFDRELKLLTNEQKYFLRELDRLFLKGKEYESIVAQLDRCHEDLTNLEGFADTLEIKGSMSLNELSANDVVDNNYLISLLSELEGNVEDKSGFQRPITENFELDDYSRCILEKETLENEEDESSY